MSQGYETTDRWGTPTKFRTLKELRAALAEVCRKNPGDFEMPAKLERGVDYVETYLPYELKGRTIATLGDLAELIEEVYDLVDDAYGASPGESGTIWTDMRYGMLRAVEATEELTSAERARPYDYDYGDEDDADAESYDFFKEHPGYVSSPYTGG